jgi:hypothetical protein
MKGFTLCIVLALALSMVSATTNLSQGVVEDLEMVNTIYRDYFNNFRKSLMKDSSDSEMCFGPDMLEFEKSVAHIVISLMNKLDLSVLPEVMQVATNAYSVVESSLAHCGLFEIADKLDDFCNNKLNCELETIGKNLMNNMFFIMAKVTELMNIMEAEPEQIGGKVGNVMGNLTQMLLNYKE